VSLLSNAQGSFNIYKIFILQSLSLFNTETDQFSQPHPQCALLFSATEQLLISPRGVVAISGAIEKNAEEVARFQKKGNLLECTREGILAIIDMLYLEHCQI